MTALARKLRLVDYFALGFGAMVGTAWLVVMDDILHCGGPLGAILGFTAGALMLLPIGYVYGKLVVTMPDAGGEVAYTARFFPKSVSFVTGWMAHLATIDLAASSTLTRHQLGWNPTGPDLLTDLRNMDYSVTIGTISHRKGKAP